MRADIDSERRRPPRDVRPDIPLDPEHQAVISLGNPHPVVVPAAIEAPLESPAVIPAEQLERVWSLPYEACEAVEDAWLAIYSDVEANWDLYALAEKITSLEYYFQEWRFKHMKTVARVIGQKMGTGGSSGVNYLVKALNLSFFPELWSMRTRLVAAKEGPDYAGPAGENG